jgi:hypothetical protein
MGKDPRTTPYYNAYTVKVGWVGKSNRQHVCRKGTCEFKEQ